MLTRIAKTNESLPNDKLIYRYRAMFDSSSLEFTNFFSSKMYKVVLLNFPTDVDMCTDVRLTMSNSQDKTYTSVDLINGFAESSNIIEINTIINNGNLLLIPVWKEGVEPNSEDLNLLGGSFVLTVEYTKI